MSAGDRPQTSLEKVIQIAIDTALKELHTCLPAIVTKVDMVNQLIDAQVTIQRKLGDQLINLPLLINVPIRYYKSKTFSITFPIEINDHVMIVFSERSIDNWLQNGGIQNPFDVRKHSLSDAFAFPMMYPQTDTIPSFNTSDLEIKTNSGDTKIIINTVEGVKIITTKDVDVETDTKVNIDCAEANIIASGNINAECVDAIVTASGDAKVEGGGKVIVEAPTIELGEGATQGVVRFGDQTNTVQSHKHTLLEASTIVKAK